MKKYIFKNKSANFKRLALFFIRKTQKSFFFRFWKGLACARLFSEAGSFSKPSFASLIAHIASRGPVPKEEEKKIILQT